MPYTELQFYQSRQGEVPVLDWLKKLARKEPKAYALCIAKFELLAEHGHELRRPHVDYLEDGLYELRVRHRRVNYRVLYFFHGRNKVILAHGITKEKEIPKAELKRAKKRMETFKRHPAQHRCKAKC